MILTVELTGRHQNQPLETDDDLDQDTEDEEDNLVQGREVDTGVERDKKDLLDHDGGIDEDIGDPCAKPDYHTADITLVACIDKP